MSKILLIHDDERRAKHLMQDLDLTGFIEPHDLNGRPPPPLRPDLFIIDIDTLDSAALVRLRSLLDEARGSSATLLLLSHGNTARAQVQAMILKASECLPANTPLVALRATIARLWEQAITSPKASTVKLANDARRFLEEMFFSGETITPQLATVGSDLITRAVEEGGVRNWVSAVQRFDNATYQHCLLVAGLAAAFATTMGLGRAQSFRLTKSALLHDVGKTRIPLSILNKPGPLNAAEMSEMRTHAEKGFELLQGSDFPEETLFVVRSHHEMLDGSGYPDGLRGDAIPDLVRLVTICDIYGALVERRVYKPPMPAAKAYSILTDMMGRLDADFVKAFRPVTTALA